MQRLFGSVGLASVGLASAAYRAAAPAFEGRPQVTAIVGATVIDGTGVPPRFDATVLLEGQKIKVVGSRSKLSVPAGAEVIDGRGLFVLPGFIDLNVHIAGDGAQGALQHGITTVHSTLGAPEYLRALRDSIRAGEVPGARLLLSPVILGWGRSEVRDSLKTVGLDSLRARVNRYLDAGVDFIEYGATSHGASDVFSPEAQRLIVEEAHKRGLPVEVHAHTAEAKRTALLAGVDLVQHPEIQYEGMPQHSVKPEPYSEEVLKLIIRQGATCGLIPGRLDARSPSRPDSSAEWRVFRYSVSTDCPGVSLGISARIIVIDNRGSIEMLRMPLTLGVCAEAARERQADMGLGLRTFTTPPSPRASC